jgi:DNA polymerase III epsilon subunit family exonuclease
VSEQERLVVLDTETTGLTIDDRIIEIGAILLLDRRPAKKFHVYINPEGRSSHPSALNVHGITDAFLSDKPLFSDVYPTFLDFVSGATLVIHNATFDMRFLQAELDRVGYQVKLRDLCPVCDTIDVDLLVKVYLQLTQNQANLGLSEESIVQQQEQDVWDSPVAILAADDSELEQHQLFEEWLAEGN